MTSPLSRFSTPAAAIGQAALGLYVWKFGSSAQIPMHFNISGEVDRWGDRTEAALVIGGMATASLITGLLLEANARRPEADDARRRGLGIARSIAISAPCLVSAMMAGLALSPNPTALGGLHFVLTAVCALMVVIGAIMGKIAPNAFVGVRTPWSLNSKLAWEKSNRLAGRLFFWSGLVGVFLAPTAPEPIGLQLFVGVMLAIAALTVLESWRVWRVDPERRAV
ncbi:MAG: SdpI family protein [Caulobacter sp.]